MQITSGRRLTAAVLLLFCWSPLATLPLKADDNVGSASVAQASAPAAPHVGPAPQFVQVAPVPEPSTGLLLGVALLFAARRNRKSRR